MAGLIKREDIDAVRERIRIEDVVGEHVTLKNAGVGSLKGLCPFHDERTPSFHVRPQLGYWHCFGCGEGGDVIHRHRGIAAFPGQGERGGADGGTGALRLSGAQVDSGHATILHSVQNCTQCKFARGSSRRRHLTPPTSPTEDCEPDANVAQASHP